MGRSYAPARERTDGDRGAHILPQSRVNVKHLNLTVSDSLNRSRTRCAEAHALADVWRQTNTNVPE
jgi:hypothetical protein